VISQLQCLPSKEPARYIFGSRGECSTGNGGTGRVAEGSMDVCHKNDGFINGERKKHKVKEVDKGGRECHSKMTQINEKCKRKGVK